MSSSSASARAADWSFESEPGLSVGEKITPISSAGLFVPSGKASYPSVIAQLGVPAVVAGVPNLAVVVPPVPPSFDVSLLLPHPCRAAPITGSTSTSRSQPGRAGTSRAGVFLEAGKWYHVALTWDVNGTNSNNKTKIKIAGKLPLDPPRSRQLILESGS
mgnify:CR=1 FL=1